MKTIFDHLRECAGNGDMPTLDAEDAQRIVETYDELVDVTECILADDLIPYLPAEYVARVRTAIKRATESRPLQIERGEKRDVRFKWREEKRTNCCDDCGEPVTWRYVATGHDHTDESYAQCTCAACTPQPADQQVDQPRT